MQKKPPSPKKIFNYIKTSIPHAWNYTQREILINGEDHPKSALLELSSENGAFITIVLHYTEVVGFGEITGYSVINAAIDDDTFKNISKKVREADPTPADIRAFLPDTCPLLFTVYS